MKVVSPLMHGYLDYLTVTLFLFAPTVFGLTGTVATLAYALAVIHLLLTLATDFELGVLKTIPLAIHGWIERAVGPLLVLVPFLLGFSADAVSRNFYIAVGVIIILVGLFSDYGTRRQQ